MPIYEYACTNCGERTEARQSFTDPPLEECPICGGRLRKLYSPVGIVFKGTGFYATDARKSSGDSDGDKKKDKKSEPKSDAKKPSESSPGGGSATPAASTKD